MCARVKLFLVISTLLITVAGCSTVKKDWEVAQKEETKESYERFMQNHPNSEFQEAAESKVETLKRQEEEQKAARLTEAMKKLRKGMTLAEVSQVCGIYFGGLTPRTGVVNIGFPGGHWVSFLDGRLDDWK